MSEPGAESDEYLSGGYFIVLPAQRAGSMNADLLPAAIITVTDCIADLVPNTWAIAWAQDSAERKQEAAAKFALDDADLDALTQWSTAALDSGELGWPGVFLSVEAALRVKAELLKRASGLVVIGISLPADLVPIFESENRLEVGQGEPGVVAAIRARKPPAPQGRALGFDVLGWEYGGFHSYICNGLETEFASVLGIKPNRHGFFDRLDDARRAAAHCNLETTGAEPALWMPWRVSLYDSSVSD